MMCGRVSPAEGGKITGKKGLKTSNAKVSAQPTPRFIQ